MEFFRWQGRDQLAGKTWFMTRFTNAFLNNLGETTKVEIHGNPVFTDLLILEIITFAMKTSQIEVLHTGQDVGFQIHGDAIIGIGMLKIFFVFSIKIVFYLLENGSSIHSHTSR